MLSSTSLGLKGEDEDDGHVSGGFYSHSFESTNELNLDMDASFENNAIDIQHLTSNHILSPPSDGESFVQLAQEQFDSGERLKFTDGMKAVQHYNLAAQYFQRAAEGVIDDTTTGKSLIFLAQNAERMSSMLEKNILPSLPLAAPANSSPKQPSASLSATNAALQPDNTASDSLSDSVLNAPHRYDQVYDVLPMSSSKSFFGNFNIAPTSFEGNMRVSLEQSRHRATGVSKVPSMDLSTSSSRMAPSPSGDVSNRHHPQRQFLHDLRLLERRLGDIGLMPLTESTAAASLRERESETSKSFLTSSSARLQALSSGLSMDESFIFLPTHTLPQEERSNSRGGGHISPLPSQSSSSPRSREAQQSVRPNNPYGKSTYTRNKNIVSSGGKEGDGSSMGEGPGAASNFSSDQTSYWGTGLGLLQMASKITGISGDTSANDDSGSQEGKKGRKPGAISAPYGGGPVWVQQSDGPQSSSPDISEHNDSPSLHWNEHSTILPSNTSIKDSFSPTPGQTKASEISFSRLKRAGEEGEQTEGGGAEGVLRLLSTIERLSEENARLETVVENLKSAQHKNTLLTAQIDQFKLEYKKKIDQVKAEVLTVSSANNTAGVSSGSAVTLSAEVKDKKLNELERTVSALLRKMTEMKKESDRKDGTIKLYKAKRDKREKEKHEHQEAERSRSKNKNEKSSSSLLSSAPAGSLPPPPPPVPSDNQSTLSNRRGIASKSIHISTSPAFDLPAGGSIVAGRSSAGGLNRSRISLTSASPSTATLRTSLKREISAGTYSPTRNYSPTTSLRKGHQHQRK